MEKSPKAKRYYIACYHTRRYKSLEGFSIYAKAFDMCYRTRYALKGVYGTLKNELLQGIMNWLCHEFSLRSMNCPRGRCGGKSRYFFVCPCSYHKLGDLSTALEMTAFFLGGDRHFDQVKRVEKSPKAERYCTTILLSPCLLQSIFSLLALIFPYFPKALSNSAIHAPIFSPILTPTLLILTLAPIPQLSLLIVFILFLFIYRCYNMLYL